MAGCPPYEMEKTRDVFVYNIPGNATEGQVFEFLTEHTVGACEMRMGNLKGRSKGYVIVTYDSFDHAAAAVESITGNNPF